MSLDARYILVYEAGYCDDNHPSKKDIKYLEENFGGKVESIGWSNFFWDKPKHKLPPETIEKLLADQVLERCDGELWEIVK